MSLGGRRIRVVVGAAAVAALAACSGGDGTTARTAERTGAETGSAGRLPVAVQRLDIVGTEYHFHIEPDPAAGLRSGWTEIRFHNEGGEAHQVMFARLKDGVDLGELAKAGAGDSSGAGAIRFVDMIGGVSYIGPGQDTSAMVDLPAGTVMAMCYVPDPDGTAHALLGMSTMLTVKDPPADATPTRPAPTGRPLRGTITLGPDGYRIPRDLPAGWYHVENTDVGPPGTGLHEFALMRLERRLTPAATKQLLDDIATNTRPEVALTALGGLGAVSPGFDGYLRLDLPRGHYLAVDFMPDAGDPRPHLLDGYTATFSR
jgi:hypothetical protein